MRLWIAPGNCDSASTVNLRTPDVTSTAPTTTTPRRRWLQFSLRTLLVATLLACCVFAWMAYRSRSGRQQRAAAIALQTSGASVQFDPRLDSDSRFLKAASEGPIGAFADMFAPNVDDVFAEDKPLTDADLVNLRGLKHLDRLVLSGTKITDAGLEHLRHVPQLPNLQLSRTAITDAGLVHLKAVPRLEVLLLDGTEITDAGLVHLRALPRLRVLDLSGTAIGDAGLAHLQDLKQLDFLQLNETRITDAGLAHLQSLERLEDLDLTGTNVTGEGFARLGSLPYLTRLYLNNTQLNDTGMSQLRQLASLVILNMENTPASDRAVDSLRQTLPDLSIDGVSHRDLHEKSAIWQDWGVRDVAAPNYLLANWIRSGLSKPSTTLLSPRLEAALKNDTREVLDVQHLHMTDALRQQLRRLRRVQWLRLSAETTGEDLSWIGKLTQLRGLSLRGANLTGGDFRHLAGLQSLQWLDLAYTEMPADQFAAFPRTPRLQTVFFAGQNITDEHLQHLARLRLPALVTMSLDSTSVSDPGIQALCGSYNLERLNLYNSSRITEQSVDALGRMSKLKMLGIGFTGLSSRCTKTPAVERLCRLLPNCSVDYGD